MIWGAGTFFEATYRLRVLGANPSFAAACLVENMCISVTDCFIESQDINIRAELEDRLHRFDEILSDLIVYALQPKS